MAALRAAQHALQRGEDVLIFPEGTRVRTDDQPVEVHGGFALIAQMGKYPFPRWPFAVFRDITPAGKKLDAPQETPGCGAAILVLLEDAPEGMKRRERTQRVEDESIRRMYSIGIAAC